jgi:hypothetical protein
MTQGLVQRTRRKKFNPKTREWEEEPKRCAWVKSGVRCPKRIPEGEQLCAYHQGKTATWEADEDINDD